MAVEKGGVATAGFIATTDISDKYPTHLDRLGKAGMRVCQNLIELNAITTERRDVGMLAFVKANSTMYQLIGGLENVNWLAIYTVENGGINIPLKLQTDYTFVGDDNGNAYQSPILIDMLADFVRLQDSTFITKRKHSYLPNCQALDKLTNGLVNVTDGVLGSQTRLTYTNTDPVTYPQLPFLDATWIPNPFGGESKWVGYVYEGTTSGIPKKSAIMAELFTDLLAVNYRFLTGNFVMGSGNILIKTLMPGSQWLDNLRAGSALRVSRIGNGRIEDVGSDIFHNINLLAVPNDTLLKLNTNDALPNIEPAVKGVDYIYWNLNTNLDPSDVAEQIADARIMLGEDEDKKISRSQLRVIRGNKFVPNQDGAGTGDVVMGINSLFVTILQAWNTVTSDGNMIAAKGNIQVQELVVYDENPAHRLRHHFSLKGCPSYTKHVRFLTPPDMIANHEGYALTVSNIAFDVYTNIDRATAQLTFTKILPTVAQNRYSILQATPENREYVESNALTSQFLVMNPIAEVQATMPNAKSLATLVDGVLAKQGNDIVTANVAPTDATYVIKTPNASLVNAQVLSTLGHGILKIAALANGAISIAQGGINPATHDYVRPIDHEEEHTARVAREGELQAEITTLQEELAALTGFTTYALMVQFILDLIGAGFTAGYPEWLFQLKYKPLLTRFKISDTTSNFGNWQSGHIWFDSNVADTAGHESGLRLTAWDSSTFFSETLKPLSLGIYGFLNQTGYLQEQRGFGFRSEFETDSNHAWYRGAKNFNLYRLVSRENTYGFITKDLWLECSYYELGNPKFRFHKEIDFNNVELYNVKTPSSDSSPTPKSWVLSEITTAISNINKTVTLTGEVTGSGNLGTNIATNISNNRTAISGIYNLTFDTNLISSPVGHIFKVQLSNPALQSAIIFDEYKSTQSLGDNIYLGREFKVFNDQEGVHYVGYYAKNPNQNWFFRCFAQNSTMYTKFESSIDFNNQTLSNVPTPILSHNPANKSYVDNKTWTTASITDFDTVVKAYKLSDFAIPTANLNLNNFKIINSADPTLAQDLVNLRTLQGYAVASVIGTTNQINATAGLNPILSLANSGVVAGSYTNANITVDNFGRITNASSGSSSSSTVTSVGISGSTGLSITGSPITTSGTISLTLSSELQALSGLSSIGLLTRTASNTYTFSTITGTTSEISVTNGNGVGGNPTISLIDTITAGTVSNPSSITYDSKGRLTSVTGGTAPVTLVTASGVLSSTGGTTPNITHNNSGVTAGVYNYPTNISVNSTGHIQAITSGSQPVTTVASSTGLTANITSGQLNLSLNAELVALSQLNAGATLGLLVRNANAGYVVRNLVAGTNITITNSDGVAGNITINSTGGSGSVTLTGAVTGTGTGTINTELASTIIMNSYYSQKFQSINLSDEADLAIQCPNTTTSHSSFLSIYGSNNTQPYRLGHIITTQNQYGKFCIRQGSFDILNFNESGVGHWKIFGNLNANNYLLYNLADATSDQDAMNRRSVRATRLNEFAVPDNFVNFNFQNLSNVADAGTSDYDAMNRRSVKATRLNEFAVPNSFVNFNFQNLSNVADAGTSDYDAMNRRSVKTVKLNQFANPDGWVNLNNYGLYNVANGQSNKDAVNLEQLNSFSGKTASISTTYTIYINSNNNSWAGYGFIGRVTNYSPSIVYEANSYHGYGLISQYEIAASQFHAFSSIKLKDVIEREQNKVETKAIDFIKKIPIVEYRHKDDTEDAQYFGVIAEELAKVDSTLIKNSFRFVPNFQLEAEVELIEQKNNQYIYLFKFQKNISDIKFDGARLQFENQECIIENVELNTLRINTKNLIEKKIVKVYGTYEHCPNVHKERIFEASIAVIQNLLKRIEILEAK